MPKVKEMKKPIKKSLHKNTKTPVKEEKDEKDEDLKDLEENDEEIKAVDEDDEEVVEKVGVKKAKVIIELPEEEALIDGEEKEVRDVEGVEEEEEESGLDEDEIDPFKDKWEQ